MAQNTIEKQQQSVLNAQKRLGRTLVKEEAKASKLREARLIRLGVLVEQMFKSGDLQLLGRFETVALKEFATGKFDRRVFELDQPLNWFDKVREDAMVAKAERPEPTKTPSTSAASSSGSSSTAGRSAAAPASASKPSSNGANGSTGASAPAAPSSTASA